MLVILVAQEAEIRNHSSKPTQANRSQDLILKNPPPKKGLVE
jgi:hypothetical protein